MITLGIEQQINSKNFFEISDYFYTPRRDYAYANQVIGQHPHLKMFSPEDPLDQPTGIIFVGMCTQIEECFAIMPETGSYVIVHRDNERPFIEKYYARKKSSVKHIYTIECQVKKDDVTALPFGTASIGGDSPELVRWQNEVVPKSEVPVFCRLNTNKFTLQRTAVVHESRYNPLVKVVDEQLGSDDFYREIKSHRFNLSLQSGGKDTTRTWETLFLGTIPIITDCVELRHFEDMPISYYCGAITEEWLASQDMTGKSMKRTRMDYWREEILNRKL